MNKEDILKKAQTIHDDEYEAKIELDGRRFGMESLRILFMFAFFYFLIFDTSSYVFIANRKLPLDILCLLPFWLCDGVYAWYRFYKLRSKKYLFYSILHFLMLLLILLTFFIESPLLW